MAVRKKTKKQEAQELKERMTRSETTKVTIPLKSGDLKLGNLRAILEQNSEKFDDNSDVYIRDNYIERRASFFFTDEDAHSEPRFILTITSTKTIK